MNEIPLIDKAIVIDPRDNIAVAKVSIGMGTVLRLNGSKLSIAQTVSPGHKIALKPISKGEAILRYGEVIGAATQNIAQGSTVHVHNMTIENLTRQYEYCVVSNPVDFLPSAEVPQFQGYIRPWGGVGTRNYVAVLSTVICSSHP